MNKAFTKETDEDDDDSSQPEIKVTGENNYVTPFGAQQLKDEFDALFKERRKVVEVVRWAAGNGDRSENGDYIYNKKRLREIDRRIRYLKKRIESIKVIDPILQKSLTKVFFGATVTYKEEDKKHTIKIVGLDEADINEGKISYVSPMAKALLKAEIGDVVKLRTPQGSKEIEIIKIEYT